MRNKEKQQNTRTLVIGDIHGCFEELIELVELFAPTPQDRIISVGDLIDRGPYPKKCVEYFMNHPQADVIMGNHEDKHIRIYDGELEPSLSQTVCIEQLGSYWKEAVEFFRSLPLYLHLSGFWIVHAGILPKVHPKLQPRNTLLRGKMPWMKNSYDKRYGGWWKHYTGSIPVVYGHSVFNDVNIEFNTYGLDTAACRGNLLSGLILESRTILQVRAKKDYWQEQTARART